MNRTDQSGTQDAAEPLAAQEKVGLVQVIGSTLAAGLGVQSSRNRERDFKQGKISTFIIAGLVFTVLFIGAVYTVVQIVLANAGR